MKTESIQARDLTLDGEAVEITCTGKTTRADYEAMLPFLEDRLDSHERLRVLVRLEHFTGMELGAAWEDLKFDIEHCTDFERVAVVGDANWEKWIVKVFAPFTPTTMRYFDIAESQAAEDWLLKNVVPEDDIGRPIIATPY